MLPHNYIYTFFLLCHDDHEQIADTNFHNVNGFCTFRDTFFLLGILDQKKNQNVDMKSKDTVACLFFNPL